MLDLPLHEIRHEAIARLIAEGVPESKTLEYKRDLPADGVGAKKEFLADVTSFANAAGGHMLFGVEELITEDGKKTGKPKGVFGLSGHEPDEAIRCLTSIINSGVDPRLTPGVDFLPIEGFPGGKRVLLLRIPRSYSAPHMVRTATSRFYSRNSAGKQPLDAREIRIAFALSEELPRRMARFRDERLARIIAGEVPVPLSGEARAALHFIPMASADPLFQMSVAGMKREGTRSIWATTFRNDIPNYRVNFDGLLAYNYIDEGASNHYTQIYRSGAIEAVATYLTEGQTIQVHLFEEAVIGAVRKASMLYQTCGVDAPFVCFLSLLGVKGFELSYAAFAPQGETIDRAILQFPEVIIDPKEADIHQVLRPVFDVLWQSAGHDRCLDYDDAGRWLRRE